MIINVLVEQRIGDNNQLFSYLVPSQLFDKIKIGIRVLVPFANRQLEGFVLAILNENKTNKTLKEIIKIIDEFPILNKEAIKLGKYMSDFYLAPLIDCYQTMLPIALKAKQKRKITIKLATYLKLNKSKEEINSYLNKSKAPRQKEILSKLLDKELLNKKDIKSLSALKSLLAKGLVIEEYKELYRLVEDKPIKVVRPILTIDQQRVINKILSSSKKISLLHGVTGSGKTEVYMRLVEEIIKDNQQAIILVPEIALTTQLATTFKNRFKSKVAILHSRLSIGEKYDEWRKIERGEVLIAIGARSAVFAPFSSLGIIIVDEEHEATYKQENSPRYNTFDIVLYRAKYHQAKIVLGSATPSLESYARAKRGLYNLLELRKRINQKELPKVMIVDMKNSLKEGYPIFSKELIKNIEARLLKKEQTMILLNRRGYATVVTCQNCGYTYKCPSCDISLTYHKTSDILRCHYCGYGTKRDDYCPLCKQKSLNQYGLGTEKIEEEIKKLIPKLRVVRMDSDTTSRKGTHAKIIKDFNHHQYDLLLGTQMIAKGLDFKKVTLVGVINSDQGLDIPDFRSGERTFQLLSQVAGRSGRSHIEGEVIFQTFNPNHYIIQMAKEHNYIGFYQQEMLIRKKLNYPPFCFIVLIKILAKDYQLGFKEAKKIGVYLRKNLVNNIVLGPTAASLLKVNNIYHFQCLIKYKKRFDLEWPLKKILKHYQNNYKLKLEINFNPYQL